jgi:hypothetical protein
MYYFGFTAQVGKKVADEGNRLARHVSMKRRYFRGEKVRERSSGSTAHDNSAKAGLRADEPQVNTLLLRYLRILLALLVLSYAPLNYQP